MEQKISIIGGDMRIIELTKMLAKERQVISFGQEKIKDLFKEPNIKQESNLQKVINKSELIIAPIPFSKDNVSINAPFALNNIQVEEIINCSKNKTLIAGAVSPAIYNLAQKNSIRVIDLMKQESLTVLNTIATAEGAIEVAMEKTKKIIHGSKILILGFGRVGKTTAKKFDALNAQVTCAARKSEDLAWIEVYGYKNININKLDKHLRQYDIIINTVPTLLLAKEKLQYVNKDVLIIDLASKPGGVDVDGIQELNLNFEWARALPGKVAPITAAEHIKLTLDNILNTEEK